MQAPITVSRVKVGETTNHPLLKPTDFVLALAKCKKLHLLLPHRDLDKCKVTLREFWVRWKVQHEDHTIYEALSDEELSLTVPVRLHGDEGRSPLVHFSLVFFCPHGFWCMACIFVFYTEVRKNTHYDHELGAYAGWWYFEDIGCP